MLKLKSLHSGGKSEKNAIGYRAGFFSTLYKCNGGGEAAGGYRF
jgi:hypothetical protein